MRRALVCVALFAVGCAARPARVAAPTVIEDADGIPIAMSPAALLAPGAIRALTAALAHRGLLPSSLVGDKLDERVERAIAALQKQQKLPATGLPNYETVAALGLSPREVFRGYARHANEQ